MEDSLFTKIIKGDIPAYKIYEDEQTFAFLDINPEAPGHTLLVPKVQVDKLYDLDDATYSNLWLVAKKLAAHYEATLSQRITFKVIGVDVPHAHIHLIPYVASGSEDSSVNPASEVELTRMAEVLAVS